MAASGITSRRGAEALIRSGLVQLDGRTVTDPAMPVDPACARLSVSGKLVEARVALRYVMLYKPVGVVCMRPSGSAGAVRFSQVRGRAGRTESSTIYELLPQRDRELFHVGRLDKDSEGLVLLTNDGELGQRLTHPRHGVTKIYEVQLTRPMNAQASARLREGVQLGPGEVGYAEVLRVKPHKTGAVAWLRLTEGKKREVRRLLAALGYEVRRLRRVQLGPLRLGGLRVGEARALLAEEIAALRRTVGLSE